jgi:Phospholipase A2
MQTASLLTLSRLSDIDNALDGLIYDVTSSLNRRFRTCLKMASSSDANMVGKLFFNIVQIKCFVLVSV